MFRGTGTHQTDKTHKHIQKSCFSPRAGTHRGFVLSVCEVSLCELHAGAVALGWEGTRNALETSFGASSLKSAPGRRRRALKTDSEEPSDTVRRREGQREARSIAHRATSARAGPQPVHWGHARDWQGPAQAHWGHLRDRSNTRTHHTHSRAL